MSENVRRQLIATITPAAGQDLTLDMTPFTRVTTASTGTIRTLVGHGGVAPYSYSIAAGAIPTNTSLNSVTGSINVTGALTQGTYTFVAQVDDSNGNSFLHAFSITVYSRMTAIAFSPPDITAARAPSSQPYSFFFEVTGNTGAVTWSLFSGSVPTGLVITTVGGKGRLGTSTALHPSSTTVYSFTVRATDAGSGETLDIPATLTM